MNWHETRVSPPAFVFLCKIVSFLRHRFIRLQLLPVNLIAELSLANPMAQDRHGSSTRQRQLQQLLQLLVLLAYVRQALIIEEIIGDLSLSSSDLHIVEHSLSLKSCFRLLSVFFYGFSFTFDCQSLEQTRPSLIVPLVCSKILREQMVSNGVAWSR